MANKGLVTSVREIPRLIPPKVLSGVRAYAPVVARSQLLFHWRASEFSLRPLTGETPTFSRASAGGMVTGRDGVLRNPVHSQPRFEMVDLDGDGLRETPGLLVEGARTNLILRSEEFDNASWTKTRSTIAANADTAPDGTLTADRIVEDATAGNTHLAGQGGATITAGATVTATVHLKAGPRTWARVQVANGPDGFSTFVNLATGALGQTADGGTGVLATKSITTFPDGWHRVRISGVVANGHTSVALNVYIAEADNDSVFDGDGASYIRVWGAQLEDNVSFASSYTPTVASSVARSTDASSDPIAFGRRDLTIAARFDARRWVDVAASGSLGILALNDADQSDLLRISKVSSSYNLAIVQKGAGGSSVSAIAAIPAATADLTVVAQYDHVNGRVRVAVVDGAFSNWTAVNNKLAEDFTILYPAAQEGGSTQGFVGLRWVKVAPGLFDVATMRKLF